MLLNTTNSNVAVAKANGKITRRVVGDFEAAIGVALPADYKEFLLSCNGGELAPNIFPVPGAKINSGVNRFYGVLGDNLQNDLNYQRKIMFTRVPKNILPIGSDSCGNSVCLSLRNESYGQIYFWDHELESEEGECATFSNLFLVGNSFVDFLSKLKKFDASQVRLMPGQVKEAWIDPEFLKASERAK